MVFEDDDESPTCFPVIVNKIKATAVTCVIAGSVCSRFGRSSGTNSFVTSNSHKDAFA